MSFLKRLFESKPLTLPQLFDLNAKEGLYRGEILSALKDVVLFIALPEQQKGFVKFEVGETPMLIMTSPDNRGVFLWSFLDQKTLQQQNTSAFPYMVDFRVISKIMNLPHFMGLIVGSNDHFVSFSKLELVKRGLISATDNPI